MSTLPKILIIDDEESVRETLEGLLISDEMELFFAENGQMGVKMAQELQPDAILLDVMMPGMNGFDTCREIRRQPALAEIPIIMITALDDRDSRLAGLASGADDFLTKPFDGIEIQIRVNNIMRLNRYHNLLAERSRFHWVVEKAEKGYVILDQRGNIQYANPRAQLYLHLPAEYVDLDFGEMLGKYYQRCIPEAESSQPGNDKTSYFVQPESDTARAFWLKVEELDAPLEVKDQRLFSVNNVTDEMSAQEDIRRIHFLVAHKLRTPLSIIYSNMNLLDRRMDVIPTDDVKSLVKTAWQSSERLVTEVRDILKYIDVSFTLAKGTPFRLGEMGNMIRAAGETLKLNDVAVAIPTELADQSLKISNNAMELIIYELLQNSKKFHPSQTPQVQVRVQEDGENAVRIQFLDDGQNMTAEQIERAAQPYSQGEKWFTGEVPGMGLGLSTVSILVWQVGGQIRITNREGRAGICIRITLPLLN